MLLIKKGGAPFDYIPRLEKQQQAKLSEQPAEIPRTIEK